MEEVGFRNLRGTLKRQVGADVGRGGARARALSADAPGAQITPSAQWNPAAEPHLPSRRQCDCDLHKLVTS